MATWTLLSPARVNREGNQIEFDFNVTDLDVGFEPTLLRSRVNTTDSSGAKTFGSLAGWRADAVQLRQFVEVPNVNPPEPFLFSGSVVSIDQSETSAQVTIALRLRPTALVSCGANLRPATRSLYSTSLLTELIVLKQTAGDAGVPSSTFTYDTGTNVPVGMNLSAPAANVGRLPGWVSGTGIPILRLHCDTYAERAKRAPDGPAFGMDIDEWTDLRASGAINLSQSNADLRPQLVADAADPVVTPTLVFDGDLLEQAPGYNVPAAGAFGMVFSVNVDEEGEEPDGVRTLMGRWSGSGGTDTLAKWQWRLAYERTSSPTTRTLKAQFVHAATSSIRTFSAALDAAPSSKTIVVYRGIGGLEGSKGELWINGVLSATVEPLPVTGNNGATNLLTVGARYDGAGALADPLAGTIDQCFVYSNTLSDASLSAIHHELARRAGIKLGPVLQPDLTQPYGDSNPEVDRRLDRWPIAMINLFGGGNYDNNPLSQIEAWRNGGDKQAIVDWFRERILRILNACPDYDIMINRPQGNYANDIIAAGIFGNMDVSPNEPIIQPYQWEALSGWNDGAEHPGVFGEFGLSDHNHRDNKAAPDSEGFARRCWFYSGNPTIDDDGAVTQNARVGARNLAPCSASFYIGSFFDPWAAKDERFRCFFVDSASKWDRKWVEIVQDPLTNENFTLVGEAITPDPDARQGAVWFSMFGFGQAPWWTSSSAGTTYNWTWSAGAWNQTPIYVGMSRTPASGVNFDPTQPRSETNEQESLRFEEAYRVCNAGAAPVAWDGDYQKYGAAWLYGGRRIPVARFTMLSPRISRVWR